ncbi:MAG: pyruvate:ferredoxin (flavodoxin) oxidoreductase [bacterium]|jgi:pyruvate-ferredoxin/flavodoxin oxidoreductase
MNLGKVTLDGNYAAAYVAHATNEVIAIYPITPSSVMGEVADEYSAHGKKNIWGQVPTVVEMQSEGGAAGAIHGALTGGSLATTFTASQGLLLMIPNMYKIAGELSPTVFHVSARAISAQALSIFGDHQDVYATRMTGFGLIASGNAQEVMDNALCAQRATLKSRVPMLHFFDGFRTSHEVQKIDNVSFDTMREMLDEEDIIAVRDRALRPENPTMRGTAQNPDIYFQARETVNRYYDACPDLVQEAYDKFARLTGRQYHLFDYVGHKRAETVIVIMGSGAETCEEAINWLNKERKTKYGLIKVRLYRPFSIRHFIDALPSSVKHVVALDRTKEPGAAGEPLYLDVVNAVDAAVAGGKLRKRPLVIGGRYGLSSKEFTPSMVNAVFEHARGSNPFHGFTVGIKDDVTHLSLEIPEDLDTEHPSTFRAKFWGLGADGTVGASKNNITVVGDNSKKYVQGFFVYDSKKAGGVTCSHLRFSDKPIKSTYLIQRPDFVAVHSESFWGRINTLKGIKEGGTVLFNTFHKPEELFDALPRQEQEIILERKLKVYCINAYDIAKELGLPGRINTTMQAAFFKVSGVLPESKYVKAIEGAIKKSFSSKGQKVVDQNIAAFRKGLTEVREVPIPEKITKSGKPFSLMMNMTDEEREFYEEVVVPIARMEGDEVPVSKLAVDGFFPTATAQFEKRSIATHLPEWHADLCTQCNLCAFVCPHAAIRPKVSKEAEIEADPNVYQTIQYVDKLAEPDDRYRIQVYPDDCTGCEACVVVCPGIEKIGGQETGRRALMMVLKSEIADDLRASLAEFERLPDTPERLIKSNVKGVMFRRPLFEFSGACAGCGETPYIKLVTQLFGDRMMQANATGCSSIFGGTAPTSPYCKDDRGWGPAWSSSLFEDNAEFGMGMRLSVNKLHEKAFMLRDKILADSAAPGEIKDLIAKLATIAEQYKSADAIRENQDLIEELAVLLEKRDGKLDADLMELKALLPYFVKKSIWIVGGDGWAYDIGYGGLDHMLTSGEDVNVLVLDTEVYSNTGGQRSKATPLAAVAKFASSGKRVAKKDLGLLAMSYRTVYVTSVSYGARPGQVVKALMEAEEYPGTSLVIAYAACMEHGLDLKDGTVHGKMAVESGYWPIYRYDPRLIDEGKNPLQLDFKEPKYSFKEYAMMENRFRRLLREFPQEGEALLGIAETEVRRHFLYYKHLAEMDYKDFKRETAVTA